ncbi:hypothetical protein G4D82_00565 [Flavobacterium sp. CYK-4]|uniref:hypothetical protein n=1 Tax=Flavobacterium lotistagni TaxID=2709660 RepID=UPI00140C70BC|nr:hypothetical protein [Flavobacterium lotistagni]NHM05701.1 hypothetical protein [Flavobacterium lotistagni]
MFVSTKIKQIIILLLLVFIKSTLYSQSTTYPDTSQKIFPSAPESSNLGRFDMIGNGNGSTGQMNYSIPLFSIPMSEPLNISLSYNYSGLLLQGKPSMTGLGWTLLATGVVNREVRGLPDESKFGYYGTESKRAIINDYMNTGNMTLTDMRDKFYAGVWDSQADKYTVSVYGISFSFKLDENYNPVYLSQHDNKVRITRNLSRPNIIDSFVVTDSKGTEYTFSAKEYTVPQLNEEFLENSIDTAWLLTEVKFPNQQLVVISYNDEDIVSYDFHATGSVNLVGNNYVAPNYQEYYSETHLKAKILDKISFSTGVVMFDYSLINGRLLYQSITAKNYLAEQIENYQFTYLGHRDLLTEIKKNNKPFYNFEYYDQDSLPPFFNSIATKPLSQDRFGYYNGAPNTRAINVGITNGAIADLNPNFNYTRKGALKKIIYPTRGYTEIEYEQNEIKTENLFGSEYYENVEMNPHEFRWKLTGQIGNPQTVPQYQHTARPFVFQYPTAATISHKIAAERTNTHITIKISKEGSDCNYHPYYPPQFVMPQPLNGVLSNYNNYIPAIRNALAAYANGNPDDYLNYRTPFLCPTMALEYGPDDGAPGFNTITGDSGGRIVLVPGTYLFETEMEFSGTTEGSVELVARFQKDYHLPPSQYANLKIGGIRVSKMISYDKSNSVAFEKEYSYNDDNSYSTGVLALSPFNESKRRVQTTNNGQTTLKTVIGYSTSFYNSLNPSFGTPVYYATIYEKVINGSEYYKTKRNFSAPINLNQTMYPRVPLGDDITKEKMIEEHHFNASNIVIKSTVNNYQQYRGLLTSDGNHFDVNPNHPASFVVAPHKNVSINFDLHNYDLNPTDPAEIQAVKDLYVIKPYKELDSEYRIIETEETEFFSGNQKINKTFFDYLNPQIHNQLSSQRNILSTGETAETKYFYAKDVESSNEPQVGNLISENIVGVPLKTIYYKAGEQVSEAKTEYGMFPGALGNTFNFLPQFVYTKKGNFLNGIDPERRIEYEYDQYGNLIRYISEGKIVSIVWGYQHSLPVLKIEGDITLPTSLTSSITQLSALADSQANLLSFFNQLYIDLADANVMISAYTYKPLVGITSVTDAKGMTRFYDYDDMNRLKSIKDSQGNLLTEQHYNYRQ